MQYFGSINNMNLILTNELYDVPDGLFVSAGEAGAVRVQLCKRPHVTVPNTNLHIDFAIGQCCADPAFLNHKVHIRVETTAF
jgi:hypothetical protein